MLVKLHPDTPSERKVGQVAEIIRKGGIAIMPTDTVYAFACAIGNKKAYDRMCRLKGLQPKKASFSLIFSDLSQAAQYHAQIDTPSFRLLKKHLPGPFTFLMQVGNRVPAHFKNGRKVFGLRVPDHNVSRQIVESLGAPLLTTSLKSSDDITEYMTDPEVIYEHFGKRVDVVIDAGAGTYEPSTVVDLTEGDPLIIRQGQGLLT